MTGFPVFRPVAEHGLLVEFGDRIDPATHAAVLALDRALARSPFAGFRLHFNSPIGLCHNSKDG